MAHNYSNRSFDSDFIATLRAAPTPEKLANGRWRRCWTITLAASGHCADSVALAKSLSRVGEGQIDPSLMDFSVEVEVDRKDPLLLAVTVITSRPADEDDYFFTNGRIFERLDQLCGPISKIQGIDRDSWMPWHFKELFGGSLLNHNLE